VMRTRVQLRRAIANAASAASGGAADQHEFHDGKSGHLVWIASAREAEDRPAAVKPRMQVSVSSAGSCDKARRVSMAAARSSDVGLTAGSAIGTRGTASIRMRIPEQAASPDTSMRQNWPPLQPGYRAKDPGMARMGGDFQRPHPHVPRRILSVRLAESRGRSLRLCWKTLLETSKGKSLVKR